MKTGTVLVASLALAGGALVAAPAAVAEPSAPQAKQGPKIVWDWRMPASVNTKREDLVPVNHPLKPVKGFKDYGNIRWGGNPAATKHKVKLTACKTDVAGSASYWWSIEKLDWKSGKRKNCEMHAKLPEGKHKITVTVRDQTGTASVEDKIRVRNILVVIFGDSYSSGVGFPTLDGGKTPWLKEGQPADEPMYDLDDQECFRTRWSGFNRSVVALEKMDKRSNITLLDVACGGGQVAMPGGLLYPQNNSGSHARPAQVDQIRNMIGNTKIDLAQLSIGGNDTGFGLIMGTCATKNIDPAHMSGCWNAEQPPPSQEAIDELLKWLNPTEQASIRAVINREVTEGWNLNDQVQFNLTQLNQNFKLLAKCFDKNRGCETWKLKGQTIDNEATKSKSLNLPAENVLQLMYPNLLRGSDGDLCYAKGVYGPLTFADAQWANKGVINFNKEENTDRSIVIGPSSNRVTVPWGPNGLKYAIRKNRDYGWKTSSQLFMGTHDNGMCADDPAIYPLADQFLNPFTDYTGDLPAIRGVVHPNVLGQDLYHDYLLDKSVPMSGLPVKGPKH